MRAWQHVLRGVLLACLLLGLICGAVFADIRSGVTLSPYLVYTAIGFVLTRRRPENGIGWLFLVVGALAGLAGLQNAALQYGLDHGQPSAWYALAGAWLANMVWVPLLVCSTSLTMLLFPDGLPSPRWRPVWWLTIGSTLGLLTLFAFTPQLSLADGTDYPNPLHPKPEWGGLASALAIILAMLAIGCSLLALASVVVRYRSAEGLAQAQIRWFAFAAAILVISIPFTSGLLFVVCASLVPLSCGLAILRYRLYDIDRIISRTASYAIVTGLLLATYAVIVISVTRLLPNSSTLAVAGATLTAAALARPLLHRVQHVVDRRFNRARYNAEDALIAFGDRLRNEIDVRTVAADLSHVVNQTLEPTSLTMWLGGGE